MKHVHYLSKRRLPARAQSNGEIVCGYLFVQSNTKCVDADAPLARLLKQVPVA